METSDVRKRVLRTIESARQHAGERRARTDRASAAYATFLDTIAVPLFKQVAQALRAEGYAFTVFTPGGSVRLTSDRTAEDFIELTLDTDGREPVVSGHASRRWSNRIVESEGAIGSPESVTDEQVLDFVMGALQPLVER